MPLVLSLVLNFLLLLILCLVLKYLFKMWQEEKKQTNLERERLLNRAMTKEWQSYQMLSQNLERVPPSPSEYVGMSDEEEMERTRNQVHGFGEVLVDLDTFDQEILSDGFNFNSP